MQVHRLVVQVARGTWIHVAAGVGPADDNCCELRGGLGLGPACLPACQCLPLPTLAQAKPLTTEPLPPGYFCQPETGNMPCARPERCRRSAARGRAKRITTTIPDHCMQRLFLSTMSQFITNACNQLQFLSLSCAGVHRKRTSPDSRIDAVHFSQLIFFNPVYYIDMGA